MFMVDDGMKELQQILSQQIYSQLITNQRWNTHVGYSLFESFDS